MATPASLDSQGAGGDKSSGSGVLDAQDAGVEVIPPRHRDYFVSTSGRPKGGSRGRQNIVRYNESRAVESFERALRIKELRCEKHWTFKRIAAEVGLSMGHVQRLWAYWVKRAEEFGTPGDLREVRATVDHHLRLTLEKCQGRIEDNPTYAAGTLKALEMWANFHGVKLGQPVEAENEDAAQVARIAESARRRAARVLAIDPLAGQQVDANPEGAE